MMSLVDPPASQRCSTGGFFICREGLILEYVKPALSFEQQADLAIARGLKANRDDLIQKLKEIGYYRLSGYWHIFKIQESELFRHDATFERVLDLYAFDRKLKLITFDAVEHVEVYLRTQLAYQLAHATNPFGYLDERSLPNLSESSYDELLRRCRKTFKRSREPFAVHFRQTYGDRHELPPYWMLVNVMDFGMVCTLYRGAPNAIRKSISQELQVAPKVLDSWLLTINTVRNVCAHHGRLWNRELGVRALIPRAKNDPRWHEPYRVQSDRTFMILTALSYILAIIEPDCDWQSRLMLLLDTRSTEDLRHMGFQTGWEACPFWNV